MTDDNNNETSVQDGGAQDENGGTSQSTASIKMMLTQTDKQTLRDLGYSDETISHMTPDAGAGIITRREAAPKAGGQPTNVLQLRPPKPRRPNPNNAPREMAAAQRWVVWRYLWDCGEWTKQPYRAVAYLHETDEQTMMRLGWASPTNPTTWRTLDHAMAAYDDSQLWSNPFDGVGYVLNGKVDEDGLCLCGVELNVWGDAEQALYAKLAGTYAERSPSGYGVHIFTRAKPFDGASCNSESLEAEAYCKDRYLTFTGQQVMGAATTIATLPDRVAEIVAEIAQAGATARQRREAQLGKSWNGDAPEPIHVGKLTSALDALPDALIAPGTGGWVNILCRAVANEAMLAGGLPAFADHLYELLDARSRKAPGYDAENNRIIYNRCLRDYGKQRSVLAATIYRHAEANGWRWPPADPPPDHPPDQLDLETISDLSLKPPPRAWAYGVWAMYGEVMLLGGPTTFGKTALGVVLSLACASGRDLLRHKVFLGAQKVLHISSEEPAHELWRRYLAGALHHQLSQAHVSNISFRGNDANNGKPIELVQMTSKGVAAVNPDGIALLERLIDESGARIVLLDPLYSFLAGRMNDNNAMGALVLRLKAVAQAKNVAIVLMHHLSKGKDHESNEAFMGASSIVFAVRSALTIIRATAEEMEAAGAPPDAGLFRVFSGKTSYAKPQDEEQWFWQCSVNLGNSAPEYPNGDSVGVVEVYNPASAVRIGPDPNQMRIMLRTIANPPFGIPLSPTKQSDQNFHKPVRDALKQAGVPMRQKVSDIDRRVDGLLDALKVAGLTRVEQVTGSGRNKVKGLVLTEAGRKWLDGEDVAPRREVTQESDAAEEATSEREVTQESKITPKGNLTAGAFRSGSAGKRGPKRGPSNSLVKPPPKG